ncbi:V-type ATP synthase subunit D [Ostreiculturibacter nitratireducens]|uniref:V-type ATP synthase subunit D n=1 Tax=Ostreiculturibacter nitratireducens TaxID=3075226 RepID=UPI0031B5BF6E
MAEIIPTRGAALALAEDKRFLENGYEFLDEKRMLLAATLLKELENWRASRRSYDEAMTEAVARLKGAIGRHGLESLSLYPSSAGQATGLQFRTRNFLGLGLLEVPDAGWKTPGPFEALDASEVAEDCRRAFGELVPLAVRIAVHAQNIRRLIREYRATERRARALENVILPETEQNLAAVTEALDESDQEEALRIRNARR